MDGRMKRCCCLPSKEQTPSFHVLLLKEIVMKTPQSKRLPIGDPGYSAELRKAMDHSIVDLIDEFTAAGWDKWETLKALTKVVCDHALAYQEDRDQSPRSRRGKSTGSVTVTGGDRGRRQGDGVR
jgi:hypothetical protein